MISAFIPANYFSHYCNILISNQDVDLAPKNCIVNLVINAICLAVIDVARSWGENTREIKIIADEDYLVRLVFEDHVR